MGKPGPRRGTFQCYEAKRRSTSAPGVAIRPWGRPEPRRPPGLDRFGFPPEDQPRRLADLKERLAQGRVRLPRVRPTVSRRPPSTRVEQALRGMQVFPAIETPETAYDATLAVGPAHLVVATNFKVAVLAKGPGAPLENASLLAWFRDLLPPEVDIVFDPRVLYDQYEDRWVLVASAMHYDDFTRPFQVLSVSCGADPRGDWWIWAIPETGRGKVPWPDHPSVGIDAHALYLSANLIGAGARLRVIPKAAAYAGSALTYTDFVGLRIDKDKEHPKPTAARTVFPCHTWGTPGSEFLISTRFDGHDFENSVIVWKLVHAAAGPELTCKSVSVTTYAVKPPHATQKVGPIIDTGDARVRSAVCSAGSIWFAFATAHGAQPTVGEARWYQLEPEKGGLLQQGYFAVQDVHHCYPAVVPDAHGNAVMVVGRSASTEHLSLHVTARRAADPPNEFPPSRAIRDGVTGHDHLDKWHRNRWGDYHAAALDPSDSTTIWVYGAAPVTAEIWGTSVASLRI